MIMAQESTDYLAANLLTETWPQVRDGETVWACCVSEFGPPCGHREPPVYVSDADRVRAGALVLDEMEPGWERLIDQDRLDMGNSYTCILGQLYDGYEIAPDMGEPNEDLGFYLAGSLTWQSPEEDRRWEALGELWITEIRNRTGE
jgi:hypothetical protein